MGKQKVAVVKTRPTRLGFVVNRDIDQNTLRDVFKFNTSIWGGFYNLFIPTDGDSIREDWWEILCYHSPDVVICVGDCSKALIEHLYFEIQPYTWFKWENRWLEELSNDRDLSTHSVTIWSLLRRYSDSIGELSPEKSSFRYPQVGTGKYSCFYEMAYGNFPEITPKEIGVQPIDNAFRKLLGASDILCEPQNLTEHLQLVDTLRQSLTPLKFTGYLLNSKHHLLKHSFGDIGRGIIVTNGSMDDLFLYHAARWSERSSGSTVAFVFEEDLTSEENAQLLIDWIRPKTASNRFLICSTSVEMETLRSLRDNMRLFLPPTNHGWHIDIERCNFNVSIPNIYHHEREQMVLIENDILHFSIPSVDFENNVPSYSEWVSEVDLSPHMGGRDGFIPNIFPDLNFLLSGLSDRSWYLGHFERRLSRELLAIWVNKKRQVQNFYLPTPEKIIRTLFENYGYAITRKENLGRYYSTMVRMVGGINEMKFLREEYMLSLFQEISPKKKHSQPEYRAENRTKAYEYSRLQALARPSRENSPRFKELLEQLSGKEIFFRGYTLKCKNCELNTWYNLTEIGEWISCKGCRTPFQMKLKGENFSYQLNQLFVEGLYQGGALAVLLTILLLHDLSLHSFMWESNYVVEKDNQQTEIDLIAICDGILFVVECKTAIEIQKDTQIENLIAELQRKIDVAKSIKAQVFIFATLQETVPQSLKDAIDKMDLDESGLRIRLVSKGELLKGKFIDADNSKLNLGDLVKLPPLHQGECFERDPKATGRAIISFP